MTTGILNDDEISIHLCLVNKNKIDKINLLTLEINTYK